MSDLIKKEGFDYAFDPKECSTCQGRCCTGESGYIYVKHEEIENISKFLGLDTKDFVAKYLFKKGYKYSIKEVVSENSHACIFFDKTINGCMIYEARPSQCQTFPFWDYFKTRVDALKLECPGIRNV